MLKEEDFTEYPPIFTIVEQINKLYSKNKIEKISKLIDALESLLDDTDLTLPISYILSIIAEDNVDLIKKELIVKLEKLLKSNNFKIQTNLISILGFFVLANSNFIQEYFPYFIELIDVEDQDLRDNVHFFIQDFLKIDANLVNSYVYKILNALLIEKNQENIVLLLKYLDCIKLEALTFNDLYQLRDILKLLIQNYSKDKTTDLFLIIIKILSKFYPSLKEINFQSLTVAEINNLLDNTFLMKKSIFKGFNDLKDINTTIKNSQFKDQELYFYIKKEKEKTIFFYEIEKDKLLNSLDYENKISKERLKELFSQIVSNDSELNVLITMLLKLGHVKGYMSKLGYFYPYRYVSSKINLDFQQQGFVNIKKDYNYLPQEFIQKIISELKTVCLISKTFNVYYSFKKITEKINTTAAKKNVINLKKFRAIFKEEDFIKLIKNIPKEYLSNFHKGTVWLTNLGKLNIEKEVENSKLVGFINLDKISEKLKIDYILLSELIVFKVDSRSGIWNKDKNIFYFSQHLKKQIDPISSIQNDEEKKLRIKKVATNLNIDEAHIISKIDENYKLIGEEIKQLDKININDFLKKVGMEHENFMNLINQLEISYFRKGDTLILNPEKIEEAKNNFKSHIIENSMSSEFISLGNFEITLKIIKDLITELRNEGKLNGLFYEQGSELLFYTEKGIKKIMLENSFLFSFEDLFYGKELSQEEINLLKKILNDLIIEKKLKGNFDENTLTFSSEEMVFASDYNSYLHEFGKTINNYVQKFDLEFQKIKKILTKQKETIYPQEIKIIQDSIDKINYKYVFWRDGLESYIRRINNKLLKDQGYTFKKYRTRKKETLEKDNEIKAFEEDPEVYDLMEGFKSWIKLFNALEIKYPNVIFYQKRLVKDPNDKESKKELAELLKQLNLSD